MKSMLNVEHLLKIQIKIGNGIEAGTRNHTQKHRGRPQTTDAGGYCENYENEEGSKAPAVTWRSTDPAVFKFQASGP